MFAVVRTGGKQYRVAQGDKIVVERLDGNAGDRITLGEVLLAGDGADLKSTDGLTVAAEIIAQAKGDKVTVFKKRRRHNYRRKQGHRQQHTILRIVAIGDQKEEKKATPKPAEAAEAAPNAADTAPAVVSEQPTANPAPDSQAQANPPADDKTAPAKAKKPAAPKAAKTPSTENAAPAKGGAKKAPKADKQGK
jgi:large subunit ribosomal protein L21